MNKTNDEKQQIKVLRIITRMSVGGPSHHVINLAKGLAPFGYKTLVLSGQPLKEEGSMIGNGQKLGLEIGIISHMQCHISLIDDFKAFLKIIKTIKKFKPQIVHTHTTKAGILGRLAAMLCGVPKIFHTYHGHIFKGYFSKIASCLIIAIERIFSAFTTNLIALTPDLAQELNQILKPKDKNKIKVISLGLDLDKNLSTPRRKGDWLRSMGLKESDFVIGAVGRLVPIKNHQLLLKALKKLCKKMPNLHLAIIGSGGLEIQLKALVTKLNLESQVHFCGIIREVEKVYSDLDLLVLSSKNEGTPVAIIEALASGCPVAATKVGGIPEVLQNGKRGFLLPLEPAQFSKALSKAINAIQKGDYLKNQDDLRQKTAIAYSPLKLCEKIHKLYRGESMQGLEQTKRESFT